MIPAPWGDRWCASFSLYGTVVHGEYTNYACSQQLTCFFSSLCYPGQHTHITHCFGPFYNLSQLQFSHIILRREFFGLIVAGPLAEQRRHQLTQC